MKPAPQSVAGIMSFKLLARFKQSRIIACFFFFQPNDILCVVNTFFLDMFIRDGWPRLLFLLSHLLSSMHWYDGVGRCFGFNNDM